MVKRYYNVTLTEKAGKKTVKARMVNAQVSLKFATELCKQVKGKSVEWTERFLRDILAHKRYLPLKRYHKKVAHRKGSALNGEKAGRFPKNLSKVFLKLLQNGKANADYKGLDIEKMVVWHCFASQGFARRSMQSKGKIGGKIRKRKSTHLEIMLMEAR